MKLRNGNRFLIACDDGEFITYKLTDGTVNEVVTVLDGERQVLPKGQALRFKMKAGTTRRLTVTYTFRAKQGESYIAKVTGSVAGGDESVDDFKQDPNEKSMSRTYRFSVL